MKGWNIKPQSWSEITEKPPTLADDVIDWTEIQNRPTMEELRPDHQWSGTSLQFETAAGTWGDLINLIGPTGLQGEQGPQGEEGPQGISSPTFELWTPRLRTVGNSTEPSYSIQFGYLYKIEKLIFAYCHLKTSTSVSAGNGVLLITGCPYLPNSPQGGTTNVPVNWTLIASLDPGFPFLGYSGWFHANTPGWRLAAETSTGTVAIPFTAVNSATTVFGSCVFMCQ